MHIRPLKLLFFLGIFSFVYLSLNFLLNRKTKIDDAGLSEKTSKMTPTTTTPTTTPTTRSTTPVTPPPPLDPACEAPLVVRDFLVRCGDAGVRLFLLETKDLMRRREKSLTEELMGEEEAVSRLGVMGEDTGKMLKAVDGGLAATCHDHQAKIVKNYEGSDLTNVFVVVRLNSTIISDFVASKGLPPLPYFSWKRLHLRVFHRRGRKGFEYRWTGRENDDDGNFKIPAEAFEDFDLKPATTSSDPVRASNASSHSFSHPHILHPVHTPRLFVPSDPEFFVWQKKASEFKTCNEANRKVTQTHSKGKVLRDEKEIIAFMKSIVVFKRLLAKLRVHSWLNCGTLLGWWRQCSIIPKDADIDLLQWNSMDDYPRIMGEILRRPKEFKMLTAKLDFGPFAKQKGKQEGFYVKILVIGGKSVDLYFNYERKIYDTRHHKGTLKTMDFSDGVCSADLHGCLVYVPCSDKKIDEYQRLYFGNDYMKPK